MPKSETPVFSLEQAVKDATAEYLEANGIMSLTIPASVRSVDASLEGWPRARLYCWECGSTVNLSGVGRLCRCSGCRASERQQTREEAYRERFEREDDDE